MKKLTFWTNFQKNRTQKFLNHFIQFFGQTFLMYIETKLRSQNFQIHFDLWKIFTILNFYIFLLKISLPPNLEIFWKTNFKKGERNFVGNMFIFILRPHSCKSDKNFLSSILSSEWKFLKMKVMKNASKAKTHLNDLWIYLPIIIICWFIYRFILLEDIIKKCFG